MPSFRDIPIKQKLLVVIGVTSGMALLLAAMGIILWDQYLFRQSLQEDLASVADIIADNSTAALAFEDPDSASQTLQALRAKEHIESACIYRADGSVLAQYNRTATSDECPPAAQEEILFTDTHLRITRPILLTNRPIGTLVLLYDLGEISERLLLYGATVLAVLLASSFVALLLSSRLRERIALPILNLANTTRSVSQTKDYGLRAQKLSEDELGVLVDAFNEMLATIQLRDAEVRRAQDQLEQRVQERTEELWRSEERFRLAVEQVQNYAIFMVDPAGHVSTWNSGAERIKGYRADEIIGKHLSIFYPPEDRDKPERMLQQSVAEGRIEDEGWRVRKDGSRFWASAVITALRDPERKLVGFSKITRDLTERRNAEEALKQQAEDLARSNADLQQFAYVASHDLQEPLRMVVSYMQIISDQYKGRLDADADECIGYAVEGATRMRQLITGLLAYSRVGKEGQQLVPTSCSAILDEVRANLDVAVKESGAVITNDPLPAIMANPAQMVQLFQNLIANAITFRGPEPPRIHVSAKLEGPDWIFAVADNGVGIAPEHYERIFVIFQRLHDRIKYSGTGLGLAICKKLVERWGGRIWVESRPGKGATFFFTVPVEPSPKSGP